MKYAIASLFAVPLVALAGAEYALEIISLLAMMMAALRFIDYLEGDSANLSDEAA